MGLADKYTFYNEQRYLLSTMPDGLGSSLRLLSCLSVSLLACLACAHIVSNLPTKRPKPGDVRK